MIRHIKVIPIVNSATRGISTATNFTHTCTRFTFGATSASVMESKTITSTIMSSKGISNHNTTSVKQMSVHTRNWRLPLRPRLTIKLIWSVHIVRKCPRVKVSRANRLNKCNWGSGTTGLVTMVTMK